MASKIDINALKIFKKSRTNEAENRQKFAANLNLGFTNFKK